MRAEQGKWARMCLAAALGITLTVGVSSVSLGQSQDEVPAKKLNKFTGKADAIKEGRAIYMKYGCSGCHGVGGGGGMGLPLTDDVWKFGSSDAVLFKVIKGQIPNQTMPKVLGDQLSEDEVWKVIAFVRSIYVGDKSKINW